MSIASELETLLATKAAIRAAILAKGVVVPPTATFADYPALILAIEGGGPVLRAIVDETGAPLVTDDGAPLVIIMV